MTCRRTLIMPCAGRSTRYPGVRPKWMLTLPDGQLALGRASASVPADAYDRLVVAVRADHDRKYDCKGLLQRLFGDAVEMVVLEADTRGPADTVAETIARARIDGPIAIKDADSFFDPAPLPDTSFVAVSDVRNAPQMANVGAKSFAVLSPEGLIVEMVEKSLASNFVCIGLYGFADAQRFVDIFREVTAEPGAGEVFVSHVMNRAIAGGEIVLPQQASGLIDVGTLDDWRRYVRPRGTLIADIDGVVFKNHSRYFPPFWSESDEPIADNVATLLNWQADGAQIVFMTARPEALRAKTEDALRALGLEPHALVMNCRHGRRFLINDHASSNPYPAAVAISVERDSASLGEHLRDWR